jgi:acetyltransferase-like isoleucine patch superfamily enzyme
MRDVVIGQDCSIGHCAEIGRGSKIGHDTRISHGVFLPPNSIIGNGVFLGPSCIFTDDKFPRAGNADYHAQPPIVEDGASVGAGAVILPGVRIGAGATVGAGAIVTKSVPAGAIVRCEPARERASQRNGIGETLPQ